MGRAFGINTGRLPAMGWGMGRWMGNSGVAQSKMVSLRHSQNTTSVAGNMELSPRRHLRYAAVEHGEASLMAAGKHMEYCPARHHPETLATAHRDESMLQMAGLLLARQHATLGKTTLRMRRRNLFFFSLSASCLVSLPQSFDSL